MKSSTFSDPLLSVLLIGLFGFLVLIVYATGIMPNRLQSLVSVSPAQLLTAHDASATPTPEISRVTGTLAGCEINLPEPRYPETARSQGITDTIYVTVTVNNKGRVIAARALNGSLSLQQSAEAAARKARFASGGPMRRSGTIKYIFKP